MKKIATILICLGMCLTLISCGSSSKDTVENTTEAISESETENVVVIDDIEETEESKSEVSKVEDVTLIHPVIKEHYQSAQDDKNIFVYEIIWPEINLNNEESVEYAGLQASFDELNKKFKEGAFTNKKDFLENYESVLSDGRELVGIMTDKSTLSMIRSDSNFVSILKTNEWFGGGAHGGYGYNGYNYDTKTGKQVVLEDIISDKDKFIGVIKDKLLTDYADVEFFDLDGYLSEYTLNDLDPDEMHYKFTWSLGYDGITIYFGQYELAPYVFGIQTVKLTFDENKDLFKDADTLKNAPNGYVQSLPMEWDENGYKTYPYVVKYNGSSYTLNFRELDDDEAVVDVLDSTNTPITQLNGRLYKTVENEEVEGPIDGLHLYQNVHTMDAFVDPEKFTLEYLDKAKGENIVTEYSLKDIK